MYRPSRSPCRGFSLIEMLIAVTLSGVVLSVVLLSFVETARHARSDEAGLDMQQAARSAVDEVSRVLQQTGYGIDRPDKINYAKWQKSIVYAGAHAVAFNSDEDPALGPIDGTQSVSFPTGETYTGEGAPATTDGAETYVYSLDATGDGTITVADRNSAQAGSYNPAARTQNPLDFALFRRVNGYDGSSYQQFVTPIVAHLFTNALDGLTFADGSTPEPLFTYLVTEDLDGDNFLDPGECVNDFDNCPPDTTRGPLLYLWGDTNFDGQLSDLERNNLRTQPVGSTQWTKNRLVSAGSYKSSTLSAALDPSAADSYTIQVADGTKFVQGALIEIGSGTNAEKFVVEDVSTTSVPHTLILSSDPVNAQVMGAPVQVLPDTLLRAIRAVQLNFTAIAPRKDNEAGAAPRGQSGRRTDHLMEYRTFVLRRTVELFNQRVIGSVASNRATESLAPGWTWWARRSARIDAPHPPTAENTT